MADIPHLPELPKTLMAQPGVAQYHQLMGEFFRQVREALETLTLQQNFGATVIPELRVTTDGYGALSQQITTSIPFKPFTVLYRAVLMDANGRTTGRSVGGFATWTADEVQTTVTNTPGLSASSVYLLTLVALPG
jgi:hypothetical protein